MTVTENGSMHPNDKPALSNNDVFSNLGRAINAERKVDEKNKPRVHTGVRLGDKSEGRAKAEQIEHIRAMTLLCVEQVYHANGRVRKMLAAPRAFAQHHAIGTNAFMNVWSKPPIKDDEKQTWFEAQDIMGQASVYLSTQVQVETLNNLEKRESEFTLAELWWLGAVADYFGCLRYDFEESFGKYLRRREHCVTLDFKKTLDKSEGAIVLNLIKHARFQYEKLEERLSRL